MRTFWFQQTLMLHQLVVDDAGTGAQGWRISCELREVGVVLLHCRSAALPAVPVHQSGEDLGDVVLLADCVGVALQRRISA